MLYDEWVASSTSMVLDQYQSHRGLRVDGMFAGGTPCVSRGYASGISQHLRRGNANTSHRNTYSVASDHLLLDPMTTPWDVESVNPFFDGYAGGNLSQPLWPSSVGHDAHVQPQSSSLGLIDFPSSNYIGPIASEMEVWEGSMTSPNRHWKFPELNPCSKDPFATFNTFDAHFNWESDDQDERVRVT